MRVSCSILCWWLFLASSPRSGGYSLSWDGVSSKLQTRIVNLNIVDNTLYNKDNRYCMSSCNKQMNLHIQFFAESKVDIPILCIIVSFAQLLPSPLLGLQ